MCFKERDRNLDGFWFHLVAYVLELLLAGGGKMQEF